MTEPSIAGRPPLSARAFWTGLTVATLLIVPLGAGTSTTTRLAPLLIFLPAIVAGLGTVRQTVTAALWANLWLGLSFAFEPPPHHSDLVLEVLTALAFEAFAIAACSWRAKREQQVQRLHSTLVTLQRQILRPLPVVTGTVMLDGLYAPVEEDRMVGGDVYEVVDSPYGTRILIGDVQGKGPAAIGAGFAVLGAFREAAFREPTLTAVVDALESATVRHATFAEQSGEPTRFVTALVLSVDDGEAVQAINCGHLPPYLVDGRHSGPVELSDIAVPLGLAALADSPRTVTWFDLPPHAGLLLCTDGVTEARGPDGRFYPLTERLPVLADRSTPDLLPALRTDIEAFTAGARRDDIAVLSVRRTPTGWQPSPTPQHSDSAA